MPAKSAAQKRLMDAAAHNPKFAKRVGIPVSVAKDFSEASKGMKFRRGGTTNPTQQGINKQKTHHGSIQLPNVSLLKHVGMKSGGSTQKGDEMKESKAMMKKEVSFMKAKGAPKSMIKHEEAEMKGMKKGGSVKPSAMGKVKTAAPSRDGVAIKGKTKGKQIVMAGGKGMKKGGKC